jgi:hypothetical protein
MKRAGTLIAKNAFANLMRGGATAIVALTPPHFLTRSLGHDRLAAWSLLSRPRSGTTREQSEFTIRSRCAVAG